MIKNKKLIILFSLILMIMLFSNIFAANIKSYKPKYGITTSKINLRISNNTEKSSIVRTLNKNINIKMIGEIGNFYIVQLASNEVRFCF
ncbi:MAG: hypothetical protein RR290_03465 [Clostridia bacterium]